MSILFRNCDFCTEIFLKVGFGCSRIPIKIESFKSKTKI